MDITARNVNGAYAKAMYALARFGEEVPTRNGPALRLPWPVVTCYEHPWERVLFDATRDANPFFHLYESLWMLDGRNDVEGVARYNKGMRNYSDDGKTFNGAYGYRWRSWFGFDQIDRVIDVLWADPASRRAVISMWDPRADLDPKAGKDIPCNLQIKFDIRDGHLNMYVTNRSNDAIWGCYGANSVHMSFLHEYVAAMLGRPVGRYYQVSLDLHAYVDKFAEVWPGDEDTAKDMYVGRGPVPKLVDDPNTFRQELKELLMGPAAMLPSTARNKFLSETAAPMLQAWALRKEKRYADSFAAADAIQSWDWRLAALAWIGRRGEP